MNLFLVLVALSSVYTITNATWFPGVGGGKRTTLVRHCIWTKWTSTGLCEKHGLNQYRIKREREQIPAKNGGNPCVGSAISYLPCNERQYVSSWFAKTLNAQTRGGGGPSGSGPRVAGAPARAGKFASPKVKNPCAKSFSDSGNRLRMFGKRCETQTRRRRSASGEMETYEVPLRESVSVRSKRQVLSTKNRDILLMLDESGSVGRDNFKLELKMARALVNIFCGAIRVSKDQTRIGIISFDKLQHDHLDFDKYFEKAKIIDHMDTQVTYTQSSSGSTCLYNGLEYAKETMFGDSRGARINDIENNEQVVVLFTDGCANCVNQGDTATNLKNLRIKFEERGIPFIVFFIGDIDPCKEIMEEFADGSQCYQVFRALNWTEFEAMIGDIEAIQCMDAWMIGPSCPT